MLLSAVVEGAINTLQPIMSNRYILQIEKYGVIIATPNKKWRMKLYCYGDILIPTESFFFHFHLEKKSLRKQLSTLLHYWVLYCDDRKPLCINFIPDLAYFIDKLKTNNNYINWILSVALLDAFLICLFEYRRIKSSIFLLKKKKDWYFSTGIAIRKM